MKNIMLAFCFVMVVSNICFAQVTKNKDTTEILQNDIYHNFPSSSTNYNPSATYSSDFPIQLKGLTYLELTVKADAAYYLKKYETSLNLYKYAFLNNKDMGQVIHRYRAAICGAFLSRTDEAFHQLFRIAEKGNYYNYPELSNEKAFANLYKDDRWKKLVKEVQENAGKMEQKYTEEIPKQIQ